MLRAAHLGYQLNDHWILQDLNLTVEAGQCLHLQGENGAGKSTALKLLTGLLSPSIGEVTWYGASILSSLAEYHAHLAYIGHRTAVKSMLTVAEQLGVASNNVLKDMRLSGILNVMGGALSAGQKQRVALSKLLARSAPLWLLDEPFTALDAHGVQIFTHYLEQHCANGGLAVISSHQPLTLEGVPVTAVQLRPLEVCA